MRRWCDRGQTVPPARWSCWIERIVVLFVMFVVAVPSLSAQTPGGQSQAPPVKDTQASPPAMPLSATERVLELSLVDAIQMAVQHNLDIERDRFLPQIARSEVEKARARFDPVTGLSALVGERRELPVNRTQRFDPVTGDPIPGAFSVVRLFTETAEVTPNLKQTIVTGGEYEVRFVNIRERVDPAQFGITSRIANPRYESSFELRFSQPLLRNFGIAVNTAPIRQAQNVEQSTEQTVLQTILDTVFNAQQRYWGLVFRIEDLGAKQESQKLAEDFLAENKVRVELGTLAPIELVQAETRVKTRQGEVIVAEAAVREAEDQLKEVLNIPETLGTWLIRIRPIDSPPFVPVSSISLDEQIDLALKSRPDYAQLQLAIASREISLEVARNQRLPRLDLEVRGSVLAFGERAEASLSNLGDAEGYQWSVGLRFEYPLGNRFAHNEFRRRNLELQQALVDRRQLQRTIVRQLRQAVRDIETAIKRVEVTRSATGLAQIQLEAEQEKFRLGLSTSFLVLNFQGDLSIARSDETRAVSDYNVAIARLDQLTGTLRYGAVAPASTP